MLHCGPGAGPQAPKLTDDASNTPAIVHPWCVAQISRPSRCCPQGSSYRLVNTASSARNRSYSLGQLASRRQLPPLRADFCRRAAHAQIQAELPWQNWDVDKFYRLQQLLRFMTSQLPDQLLQRARRPQLGTAAVCLRSGNCLHIDQQNLVGVALLLVIPEA